MLRKTTLIPLLAASALLLVIQQPAPRAATPPAGTIGPTTPDVRWEGPVKTASFSAQGCPDACDFFNLTVDVPASYWNDHSGGAKVKIAWPPQSGVFEMDVSDSSGTRVARAEYDPTADSGKGEETLIIPSASREAGPYVVRVRYTYVVESSYSGTATFLTSEGGSAEKGAGAVFDTSEPLTFAPTTTVSAHFLGAEPQMTMERRVNGAPAGVTNPDRIFVDYPLSFRAQIGQLNRSEDGGDSFRLLFDPTCAGRSRPTCQTGGGGDSDNDVNLFNGTLFFADQEGGVAQESVASSTDHGDSFPPNRQWAVTNTTSAADREWLAAADDGSISVGPRKIHAFLAYARVGSGIFVQGIDQEGLPIPQPVAQIGTTIGVPGRIEVDTTGGPGHGWVYVAYPDLSVTDRATTGVNVATAPGEGYQDRTQWSSTQVVPDFPNVFVWLALDSRGNAYVTWVDNGERDRDAAGQLFYSYSAIDDPANNPASGGRPGSKWSQAYRVNLPELTSTVFPTITAGDPGRIGIAFMGSTTVKGLSSSAGADDEWHTYSTVIENALAQDGPPVVHTGRVSHRVNHTGPIDGSDSSLLDFIDIDHDQNGRVGVVFMDNHSTFAEEAVSLEDPAQRGKRTKPFTQFAKQVSGPSLVASSPDATVAIPRDARADRSGDSTWPNRANGRYLPSLDALGASLDLEGDQIVARIPLPPNALQLLDEDLVSFNATPSSTLPAERVQYVVRFSDADDVFHMSSEVTAAGALTSFGGRLDTNDANAESGTVLMASYRSDPFYAVTGHIENGTLVLRGAASAFGMEPGTELVGVSAFTMAGPGNQKETALSPMRTVDATPPFDTTLTPRIITTPSNTPTPSNSPTPGSTATPSQTPTPGNSPTPDPSPSATPSPAGRCDIVGTPGNDYLPGTDGDETICGRGGDDVLIGGGGNDILIGGEGDDRLFGNGGSDRLNGQSGSDELRGGPGKDIVLGRRHADDLYGGAHNDSIRGGRGRDRCRGGAGRNHLRGCERP